MNHSVTEQFDRDCEDALGWIARFRSGDASEQDRESFALWLAEAPARKLAMDSMLDMYGDLGALGKLESSVAALPPAAIVSATARTRALPTTTPSATLFRPSNRARCSS